MARELELLGLDGLFGWFKRSRKHGFTLEPGQTCLNCETVLEGQYCHVCGQSAHNHHRTLPHMLWEAIEGLFHFDGRLWRTLPPLFFRPGILAKDYMSGRMARHVPPLRTFLVALLLYILGAQHFVHQVELAAKNDANLHIDASLNDPAKIEAARIEVLAEAEAELRTERAEAEADYQRDLAASVDDEDKAAAKQAYDDHLKSAQADYDAVMADPVKAAKRRLLGDINLLNMTPEQSRYLGEQVGSTGKITILGDEKAGKDFQSKLKKAIENPKLLILKMFKMAHWLAILLLPIMCLVLGLIYVYKRQFYLYDHFLVSTNILSFVFLTNALGLVLPAPVQSWWFLLLTVWTPVNIFMNLRGAYGSGIFGAIIKTLLLWCVTSISFIALIVLLGFLSVNSF